MSKFTKWLNDDEGYLLSLEPISKYFNVPLEIEGYRMRKIRGKIFLTLTVFDGHDRVNCYTYSTQVVNGFLCGEFKPGDKVVFYRYGREIAMAKKK